MKRAFLFLLLISCAGIILAQDIVVTKAGTTIEDVTVILVTADNVTYMQAGTQKSIASSEVDGVLYSDGRFVNPPSKQTVLDTDNTATAEDSWDMDDAVDVSTKPVSPQNTQTDNRVTYDILFMKKSYSKECRKEGERVFNETYAMEAQQLKQVRKSMTREERKAANIAVFEKAMNASNNAVLECSGIKDKNSTQSENESSW